jgi:hypothetical protein
MSDYNLTEANKWFIRTAAYLARDMDWDSENPPTERQVENWRESTMKIIQQHQQAHKRIQELETQEKDDVDD